MGSQEGLEYTFPLSDDDYDPATIARIVAYLYQDDYDDFEGLPPHVEVLSRNEDSDEDYMAYMSKLNISAREHSILRMKTNLLVFTVAEFLNIQDLKAKATDKFVKATKHWTPLPLEDLPDVIEALCQATKDEDVSIRAPILEHCAEHYKAIIAHNDCLQTLSEYGDFAVELIRAVGKRFETRLGESRNENAQVEEKLNGLQTDMQQLKKKAEAKDSDLEIAYHKLDHMWKRRLRSSNKGGKVIGNTGKTRLRDDIQEILRLIDPHAETEVSWG